MRKLGILLVVAVAAVASHADVAPDWRVIESPYPTPDSFVAPFSVRDFGAKADGVTDDTAAFQRGLNQTGSIGGGALYVPAGKYAIRGRLTVPTGVTLRGIWQNPSTNGGKAVGSILMLYAGRGKADGKPTIELDKCSGIRELTLWYPEQNADSIVPYPFTVKQLRGDNATVENVTLVNTYQGIQIGPGGNELHFVRQVYGTPLKVGVWYDSTTDIGRLIKIHFSPDFWTKSGLPGAPAANGPHRSWLLKNGTGLHMGRSDWEYGAFVRIEGYGIGMQISKGVRGTPNAQFYGFEFIDCATGIRVADSNPFGLVFTRCTFKCRDRAVHLEPTFRYILLLNNCVLSGKELIVHEGKGAISLQSCRLTANAIDVRQGSLTVADCTGNPEFRIGKEFQAGALVGNRFSGGARVGGVGAKKVTVDSSTVRFRQLPAFPKLSLPALKPSRRKLYVVSPMGTADASAAIRKTLVAAKGAGGGIVFLKGGDYVIRGNLTIPSGVELKGVYDVPHHTIGAGSVLQVYTGRGKSTGRPTIVMESGSGLTGVSANYPDQRASAIDPYPFLIAGKGKGIYIVNVNCANAYQLLDMMTHRCDNHYIDYLSGAPLKVGVRIGAGARNGIIQNTQFNPHYWSRAPNGRFYRNRPAKGARGGDWNHLWEYQKDNLDALMFGHCVNQLQLQNFVYGSLYGIHFVAEKTGSAEGGFILGHGTDGSKISAYFESSGAKGLHMVNSELVCMSSSNKEYIVCSKDVRGEIVLHNTMLWGQPDRSGTIEGGHLVMQQGTFTQHGRGFRMRGGALSLFNCNYLQRCRERESHLFMEAGARAHVAACNFPGPLVIDAKPAPLKSSKKGVSINANAHRAPKR